MKWGLPNYFEQFTRRGISNCRELSELEPYQYETYSVTLKADVDKLKLAIDAMKDIRSRGRVCDICRHGDESSVYYEFGRQESVSVKKYDYLPFRSMDRPPNRSAIHLPPIAEVQ